MQKTYKYDYPEQREIAKDLKSGDVTMLAGWTGYDRTTIYKMCAGTRRMADKVKLLIEKIYEQRAEIEQYLELQEENIAE